MGVRFVVLADSKRAVASAFEGFTGGLGFRRKSVPFCLSSASRTTTSSYPKETATPRHTHDTRLPTINFLSGCRRRAPADGNGVGI